MRLVPGSERILADAGADPVAGEVRWSAEKSLWIGAMTLAALAFGPLTFSWPAFALFLVTTGITLCFGHSVGMHRRLIHGSFKCPLWLEYVCVYLGVLVGMTGPIGMTRIHDTRDWAQRQPDCHPFLRHGYGFWADGWRQLHVQAESDAAAALRARAGVGERPRLRLPGAHLIAAAGAVGDRLPRAARTSVRVIAHGGRWRLGQ